jgi:hypothetical protein
MDECNFCNHLWPGACMCVTRTLWCHWTKSDPVQCNVELITCISLATSFTHTIMQALAFRSVMSASVYTAAMLLAFAECMHPIGATGIILYVHSTPVVKLDYSGRRALCTWQVKHFIQSDGWNPRKSTARCEWGVVLLLKWERERRELHGAVGGFSLLERVSCRKSLERQQKHQTWIERTEFDPLGINFWHKWVFLSGLYRPQTKRRMQFIIHDKSWKLFLCHNCMINFFPQEKMYLHKRSFSAKKAAKVE